MEQKKIIFLIFLIMPKNGFPMPTAKNQFQILNLHPKKHVFKTKIETKKHDLKQNITLITLTYS